MDEGSCRQKGEVADLQAQIEDREAKAAAAPLHADREGVRHAGQAQHEVHAEQCGLHLQEAERETHNAGKK